MRISKPHKNLFSDMNKTIHRMATEKQKPVILISNLQAFIEAHP
ncbi:hypothetical protein SynA1560_02565 [Synechococcus sp. A15-60]|nr:hypothetical protein SynA1560_02565 [Synechococcus sp. A15-60]